MLFVLTCFIKSSKKITKESTFSIIIHYPPPCDEKNGIVHLYASFIHKKLGFGQANDTLTLTLNLNYCLNKANNSTKTLKPTRLLIGIPNCHVLYLYNG